MENILDKVDFDTFDVYSISISIYENDGYNDGKENEVDEYGQAMDAVSDLRRTIKASYPCENKKIIKSISPLEQKEDEEGTLCRDINMEYYLLVNKEEMEDFCTEELHDILEEEWYAGSAGCDITINDYKV